MSAFTFLVEMSAGQPLRQVDADTFAVEGAWLIFRRSPPTGGAAVEYWRANLAHVIGMETKRGEA